jgi:hypothetical protein
VWFETLRTWIQVLTDQDVDPGVEASLLSAPGVNLEVLTVDGENVSLPRRDNSMRIAVLEVEALDERLWRKALDLASKGSSPPIEYLFARSARVQLRVHQYRRAVIDAASAVELALSDLLQANFANLPLGIQATLSQPDTPTLGWFIDILTNAGGLPPALMAVSGKLPSDLKTGLNSIRKNVIHRHATPTHDETERAVVIASEVVKLVTPLPQI